MTDSQKKVIADRLAEARRISGLSQGQVSRLMGMHRPTISEIESGNRNVSAQELMEFSKIYGIEVSWIIGESQGLGDSIDGKLQLAFRELQKLQGSELDKLMRLLTILRGSKDEKEP